MKKVNPSLLAELIKAGENQKPKQIIFEGLEPSSPEYTGYQKGHNVPEGTYKVKLLDVKCHNKETYKLTVKVIKDWLTDKPYPEEPIITGYARRGPVRFEDLAFCFGDGTVSNNLSDYKDSIGIISLNHSGWITLIPYGLSDL